MFKNTIISLVISIGTLVGNLGYAASTDNSHNTWEMHPDVAQYKWASPGSKWDNEVARIHGATVEEAKELATTFPNVTYFTYVKGAQLCLEGNETIEAKGCFQYGDVIFFTGEPWFGSAPDLADSYVLKENL